MRNEKFLILTFLFLIGLFSACEKKTTGKITARFESSKDSSSYTKIENVDFRNFSYSSVNNFTLVNGERPYGQVEDITFRFKNIQYCDLTNDGQNEAVINIYIGHATTSANSLFIYTLENDQPKKLREIFSGYHANGGLKDFYARDKILTVEFFGNTKFDKNSEQFIFPNIQKYPEAECCPNKFTRFNFNWNDGKFVLTDEPKLLDYNWKKEKNENLLNREES